jgi:hypothetical protein
MENLELQEKLQGLYDDFYTKLKLDENHCIENRKFQNKIRIGSNYFEWNPKILIIGLDAGSDNGQSLKPIKFEPSIKIDDDKGKVNPHMSGVYGTVLYFQKDEKWKAQKDKLLKSKTFNDFLKKNKPLDNEILSSFAIVNLYSFVTQNRKKRTGNKDRVFIDKQIEKQHLIDLINTMNPDIIVVQSKDKSVEGYIKEVGESIKNRNTKIYIRYHPAVFGRNIKYRQPKIYFDNL